MRAAACFQLALVSQVNKRIRASLRIHLRTSSFNEPHPLIEANGLGVLHVDVCAQLPVQPQSMLQQPAADAGATDIRIDEQRLHVRAIDQHEAMGLVMFIDSNSHRRMRQKLDHFGINGLSIIGTEKVMGGVYGTPPKVNQSGTIFRT
ncbi:hypothetical protein ACM14_11795 [Delftia sp. JD2]|nr:hypothetical protein ACM14_11795 [Delftia sp. JD2]